MRTIKVTGNGEMKIHPDTTRITITLEGSSPEYGETLRRSSKDTEAIKELLMPFGFAKSDLKTLSFNVDTEHEGYRDRKGEWKQRFKGYKFRHIMKVEFASDNGRLGKMLYALAHSRLSPEFRISYTVADPEAAKNDLLAKAIADSRTKASVLTNAGGVKLGEIQSIDYSWGSIDIEYRPMRDGIMLCEKPMAATNSYEIDIEPDNIKISDTVTVIWEII